MALIISANRYMANLKFVFRKLVGNKPANHSIMAYRYYLNFTDVNHQEA